MESALGELSVKDRNAVATARKLSWLAARRNNGDVPEVFP
jgi:hypothetical protein